MNPSLSSQPVEMGTPVDLREYVRVLWLQRWLIAVITLLLLLSTVVFSALQTPQYVSDAGVLVESPSLDAEDVPTELNMETEKQLVESASVAQLVQERLSVQEPLSVLLEGLTVDVTTDSEILTVSYRHPDPEQARLRAQAFSQGYLEFRRQRTLRQLMGSLAPLERRLGDLRAQISALNEELALTDDPGVEAALRTEIDLVAGQVVLVESQIAESVQPEQLRVGLVVDPAERPTAPASPNYVINVAVALVIGLALGAGITFLRDRLGDRIRGSSDLESYAGVPVLAVVPRARRRLWTRHEFLISADRRSAASESLRTLRASFVFTAVKSQIRSVLVTSPHSGEGKSTITANLAFLLAQSGKRVVVVSGDVRSPTLDRFFQPVNGFGGPPALGSRANGALGMSNGHIRFIPAREVQKGDAELLDTDDLQSLLEILKRDADFVLVDAPPIMEVADALTLSALTDGVLLIADGERTGREDVREARKRLEQINATVIGSVLNRSDRSGSSLYYQS
jgi:polysaccharide biosynthesis transport protein